ncbi:scoloptoxin SSD552-like [Rhodnius prolixus]|uniref:scoloptoxin SSD552-like n=1 Tax=Rhodnius prolixus TaxID=13249 RepID=UPI003D189871
MKINLLAVFGAIIFFSHGVIAPLSFKKTYCCMRCGTNHVMCKYPLPGPGPACEQLIQSGLIDADKKMVLDVHNELRNYVASGKLKQYPAKSANMRELEWDDELELFAKRHAEQCIPKDESVCCDSIRFRVGQNYAVGRSFTKEKLTTIEQHVRNWYHGFNNCGSKKNICTEYTFAYDFTQMTWGNSYKLGCSYSEFEVSKLIKNAKVLTNILICNYAPLGNMRGQTPFVVGEPCSACSNGTKCSEKYPSLCTANAVRIHPNRKYLFTMASISLVLITLKSFI